MVGRLPKSIGSWAMISGFKIESDHEKMRKLQMNKICNLMISPGFILKPQNTIHYNWLWILTHNPSFYFSVQTHICTPTKPSNRVWVCVTLIILANKMREGNLRQSVCRLMHIWYELWYIVSLTRSSAMSCCGATNRLVSTLPALAWCSTPLCQLF